MDMEDIIKKEMPVSDSEQEEIVLPVPETDVEEKLEKDMTEETDAVEETENRTASSEGSEWEAAAELLAIKKQKKARRKKIWNTVGKVCNVVWPVLLVLFAFWLIMYYIFFPGKGEFHSDCTDTLYWAEAAMQGNGLINPDFTYAALMPLGGNLLMQIWIPVFGISMTTHAFGMATFLVLFVTFLCLTLRELHVGLRWGSVTVSALLLTLCMSEKLREIFWGHIIYYSLGILFLLIGLFLVLHIYNLTERRKTSAVTAQKILFMVLLLVDFVLCCTNSSTAIALFALPILGAVFCERFLDYRLSFRHRKNLTGLLILIICGVGLVAGMKLGSVIAGDAVAGYADAYSRFSNRDEWWQHVESLPIAFLDLLGLQINRENELISLDGIHAILKLFYAAFLAVVPIIALCCYKKIQETGTRILIWAHFVVTAFILIGYICGLLSAGIWRLSPMLCTSVLVSFAFLRWMAQNVETKRLSILLCLPIAYLCLQSGVTVAKLPADYIEKNENYRISEYLKSQDLTYGYASFWRSQAITVLSDSEVKARTVDFLDTSGVQKNPYQSNKNWFEDQPDQENYFLLMDAGELEKLRISNSELCTLPHEELQFEVYTIWVYSENIF